MQLFVLHGCPCCLSNEIEGVLSLYTAKTGIVAAVSIDGLLNIKCEEIRVCSFPFPHIVSVSLKSEIFNIFPPRKVILASFSREKCFSFNFGTKNQNGNSEVTSLYFDYA